MCRGGGGPEYEAHPRRALVSNQRAKSILGWAPQHVWPLEEAL